MEQYESFHDAELKYPANKVSEVLRVVAQKCRHLRKFNLRLDPSTSVNYDRKDVWKHVSEIMLSNQEMREVTVTVRSDKDSCQGISQFYHTIPRMAYLTRLEMRGKFLEDAKTFSENISRREGNRGLCVCLDPDTSLFFKSLPTRLERALPCIACPVSMCLSGFLCGVDSNVYPLDLVLTRERGGKDPQLASGIRGDGRRLAIRNFSYTIAQQGVGAFDSEEDVSQLLMALAKTAPTMETLRLDTDGFASCDRILLLRELIHAQPLLRVLEFGATQWPTLAKMEFAKYIILDTPLSRISVFGGIPEFNDDALKGMRKAMQPVHLSLHVSSFSEPPIPSDFFVQERVDINEVPFPLRRINHLCLGVLGELGMCICFRVLYACEQHS